LSIERLVTLSAEVASFTANGQTIEGLLHLANQRMDTAKNFKNTVVSDEPFPA
jgi:hypothetical protein